MKRLAWIIPFLVLLVSGATKLILADGTPPRLASPLLSIADYPVWMRLLGLLELGLAAAVASSRWRPRALVVTNGLLVVFTLLVAVSAADLAFVGDCGCFGGAGTSSRYYGWLVLRNAALVAVTVLAWRRHWREAVLALVLMVSIPGLIGEMQLRRQAYAQLDATAEAASAQGFQGRLLPPLALITADGTVTAAAATRPGDLLAFVSRDCPHCLALAPALVALDDSLQGAGRRVLPVIIGSPEVSDDWRELFGWHGRDAVASLDRIGLRRLGVDAVPRLLQLGPDGEVQYNEAHPLPTSLWKTLRQLDGRIPGLGREVWSRVAGTIFGEGWILEGELLTTGASAVAAVLSPDGAVGGQLHVVQDGWRHADLLELAVGLGPDGRIVGVVPLAAGAHARLFTPAVSLADSLAGLSLDEADALLARHERRPGLGRSVWHALRLAMARVPR